MDTSGLDFNIFSNHQEHSVDLDYRGIRIKVYKNGDQYDKGSVVVICRKRFKHWLTFLDYLTKKLNLMAPVHEIYRTDGLRIQHFEEIENGGSYVAVSQRPFLHKPYGLLSEDRQKWNINSKIESLEQSALDSAESVDIYLKQRGYTSRTGLPFPFDGGVCVNHSLTDFGHNRVCSTNLSEYQHSNEQKSESNNSKNDVRSNGSRKEQQKSNSESESECHLNSIPEILLSSIPKAENNAPLHDAGTLNDHNIEQNFENLPVVEPLNSITNETGENGLCSDIITPSDRKPTVKKIDEFITIPVVQIPVSSRDTKNMRSLVTMQMMNFNDYPLPTRNTEAVITVVNDDALVRTSNSPVIIVNISTGQNKHDEINNVNKNADDVETAPLAFNKVKDAEVPSENLEMKMPPLSNDTETVDLIDCMKDVTAATPEARTLMAVFTDCAQPTTATDRFPSKSLDIKDERLRVAFLKKDEDDQYDDEKNDITGKNQSSHISIARGLKCRVQEDQSEDGRPTTCTISNPDKVHESLTSDKILLNRKQVTLTTPHVITSTFISNAVDTDVKLKMESKEIFSDSEKMLRSSPQQITVGSSSVDILAMNSTSDITTAVITDTLTNNNTTDITYNTATSSDIITHTAIRGKEISNPQKRYHSESHTSFEADFTPRHDRTEKKSTGMKTVQKLELTWI
ncbi:hypothetical protein DINM_005027 [Dirofilaria immitis]|nr:hypothetical protein [Dirofilaria immitis]